VCRHSLRIVSGTAGIILTSHRLDWFLVVEFFRLFGKLRLHGSTLDLFPYAVAFSTLSVVEIEVLATNALTALAAKENSIRRTYMAFVHFVPLAILCDSGFFTLANASFCCAFHRSTNFVLTDGKMIPTTRRQNGK
jgi:hypothetical protein